MSKGFQRFMSIAASLAGIVCLSINTPAIAETEPSPVPGAECQIKALEDLLAEVRRDPVNADNHRQLAPVLLCLAMPERALHHYYQFLKHDKQGREHTVATGIAVALIYLNKYDRAIEWCEKAIPNAHLSKSEKAWLQDAASNARRMKALNQVSQSLAEAHKPTQKRASQELAWME